LILQGYRERSDTETTPYRKRRGPAIYEDLKIHPNQFYEWQKLFFENGVKAFESDEKQEAAKLRLENDRLTQKLQRKDAVLSELMEEHLTLKKNFGET
jgi:transposase